MDANENIWIELCVEIIDEDLLKLPQRDVQSYLCKICIDKTKQFHELNIVFDTTNPLIKKTFLLDQGLRVTFSKYVMCGGKLISQRIACACDMPPSVIASHSTEDVITTTATWKINPQKNGTIEVNYMIQTTKHSRILSGIYMKFNSDEIKDVIHGIRESFIQMAM